MLEAKRYVVSGRVQGVGFRFFVHDRAVHENLTGWVRNQPNRTVEVVAQGDAESLLRFEMALRRGPAGARVDDVAVDREPVTASFTTFQIEP
jgi:acylphosphatase